MKKAVSENGAVFLCHFRKLDKKPIDLIKKY